MTNAFIASEYNPFHNGHLHHIEETRKNGADNVICIMSGNFVQRGTIAVAEKHLRAKAAILSGADLVIELPLKYAISTASYFAEGFVKTAKATGLSGFISFGAKDSLETLNQVKNIIFSKEAEEFSTKCISEGISYPKAKSLYIEKYGNKNLSAALDDANNVLALEYIKARDKFFPELGVSAIERKGTMHDSDDINGNITSAGNIRRILYDEISEADRINRLYEIKNLIPEDVFNELLTAYSSGLFPSSPENFELIQFARLLSLTKEDFLKINNVTGGLENRIIEGISRCNHINELCDFVKSKVFTHSRLRQIMLSACLGITKIHLETPLQYIRVLAFNDKGRALLNTMRNSATVPVITNISQADTNSILTQTDVKADVLAGKLFNLSLPCPLNGNPEYDIPPVYIKD